VKGLVGLDWWKRRRRSREPPRGCDVSSITKTFMFTDIVSSTDLAGSLGDSAWKRKADPDGSL